MTATMIVTMTMYVAEVHNITVQKIALQTSRSGSFVLSIRKGDNFV